MEKQFLFWLFFTLLFIKCINRAKGVKKELWDSESSGADKRRWFKKSLYHLYVGLEDCRGSDVISYLSFYFVVFLYQPLPEIGYDEMNLWSDKVLPFLFSGIVQTGAGYCSNTSEYRSICVDFGPVTLFCHSLYCHKLLCVAWVCSWDHHITGCIFFFSIGCDSSRQE